MPRVILRMKVQIQRRALIVQLDGHQKLAALSVNKFHLDPTGGMEKFASATLDSFVLVLI